MPESYLPKVLIVDDVFPSLPLGLIEAGFDVFDRADLLATDVASFIKNENIEGLVVRSKLFLDADFFAQVPQLKWVARAGAGMDNIDVAAAELAGVELINSENANSDAVGEQTLAMLLGWHTRLIQSDNQVKQGVWDREGNRGMELKGKIVGIIGYGNTGMAVAKKLSGFEVEILAYDKYKQNYTDNNVTEATLEQLMEESDVISLHIPLTKETLNFVDDAFVERLRKPILLLNLSRGQVVDIQSVIKFLNSGKLSGYCADVLPIEPPVKSNSQAPEWYEHLVSFSQVMLSPHVGGWTVESYRKISEILLHNIKKINNIS